MWIQINVIVDIEQRGIILVLHVKKMLLINFTTHSQTP